MISFVSIYLAHPRAVTYISWRKTSSVFAEGTVVNCLLTCSQDNICRIWCESRSPDESSIYNTDINSNATHRKRQKECLDRTVQKLYKMRYNSFLPYGDFSSPSSYFDQPIPHTPASLISSNPLNEDENTLNPISTLSSPHSSSTSSMNPNPPASMNLFSKNFSTLRFHLATTINPSQNDLIASTIPKNKECFFTLQWLNNKDLYNLFSIEQFIFEMQKKTKAQGISTSTTNQFDNDEVTITTEIQADFVNINEKRPTIHGRVSLIDDSKHFNQIRLFLKKLIDEWKTSPDVVFSIHPLDGSLLLWVIDCLDQSNTHRSAVMTTNPFNPSLMNYPMYPRQVQVSFSARKPEIFPLGDALSLQPHLLIYCHDLLFNQYLSLNQSKQKQHLPMINMITKHTNGTLNLWSLTFHEQQKFQSLICVTHSARMCGHPFPIRLIICHPIVPLVLTSSYDNEQSTDEKKQRFDNSLILWSSEPIGPLTVTGGITELARMQSVHRAAFRLLAWFPMVMPCLNINLLRESPSVLFCASDGFHLRVYQVVCNAKTLLTSQFSTSKSYQLLNQQHSDATTTVGPKLNVVSNQSTARPSCVISLAKLDNSECVGKCAALIHIFPANAIDDRSEQNSTCKIYYLVLVEKSSQSRIHMWKISIDYPDDDEMTIFNGEQDWCVQVQSWKVSDYILPLESNAELQSVDVAFGHLSSSTLCYSDASSSSPYLLSSTHSDGKVRFWTCQHQSTQIYDWTEWTGVSLDNPNLSRLQLSGQLLAISNAYCGRLAVAMFDEKLQLGIYECESTGGTSFHCETLIQLNELNHLDEKTQIHFDWASIENGAHLLATSIGIRYVFIYSYAQNYQWTKLRTIELSSIHSNTFLDPNLSLKWIRGGLLLVGLNCELQVYSQWSSLKRQCNSVKPEPLIKPKRRINTSNNLKKLAENNIELNSKPEMSASSWLRLDSIDVLSLFHAARNAAPVLPQYHPTVLLELVRFGKYRRVKAILAHLTRCIVSTVHSVEGKVEMKLMRTRTFSIANNDDNEPSIAEVERVKFVEIETIPLLPLFALFDSDHEIVTGTTNEHGSTSADIKEDPNEGNGTLDKYEDLFNTNSPSEHNRDVAFQFDEDQEDDAERRKQIELNKFRRELLSNRHWSPKFDARMVDLLVDYFQRVRLATLTSLEQMYLLALADTLANSSNEPLFNQQYAGDKPSSKIQIENSEN